jgi:hypothetical protein
MNSALDPSMLAAEVGALRSQVASLTAERDAQAAVLREARVLLAAARVREVTSRDVVGLLLYPFAMLDKDT